MTLTGAPGRIEILNRVPIYFEVHGSGEPLLLLHGFSGCSQDWSAFVEGQEHAAEEKFQLLIPDLRGHGRSFAPREGGLASTKSAQPGVAVLPEFSACGMTKRRRTCLRCSTIWGLKRLRALG
jgi:pimeloyl-ACP methyl ester carboxylesterase